MMLTDTECDSLKLITQQRLDITNRFCKNAEDMGVKIKYGKVDSKYPKISHLSAYPIVEFSSKFAETEFLEKFKNNLVEVMSYPFDKVTKYYLVAGGVKITKLIIKHYVDIDDVISQF